MLEKAAELIRSLCRGEVVSTEGQHYSVDSARIYTLPDEPPPIFMSAFGPKALELAARVADGFISTKPDADGLRRFRELRRRPPTRPSITPPGSRPTPGCPVSSRRCCHRQGISSRPPNWSPAT